MTAKIIQADNEFELVSKINEEASKLDVFATQPIEKLDKTWVCFIYFDHNAGEAFSRKSNQMTSFQYKSSPATHKQINYLKKLKIKIPEGITKIEAMRLIDEATRK